jgi:putative hydrolase of HD superfamily
MTSWLTALRGGLARKFTEDSGAAEPLPISHGDVCADVDAILDAFGLQGITRFCRQVHWDAETERALLADAAEPGLKLENVAAHSWHVADAALLLAGQFFGLDAGRCVLLAVLHDKMELYTGDYDPVGPDGQGSGTHAFNQAARDRKEAAELDAMERYLIRLRPGARNPQRRLLTELIGGRTEEARFVRAVDKLQALAFVLAKKDGVMSDAHIRFTLRYSGKAKASFPGLGGHHRELVSRLLKAVAKARNVPLPCIESRFRDLLTS